MKTFSFFPIALAGVVGSVFLIHIHAAPPATAISVPEAPIEVPSPAASAAPAAPVDQARDLKPALPAARSVSHAPIAGRVAAGAEIDVKSRTAGEVLRVHADLGDIVKQGQLLAELDPADAQNQIARAQATLAASQARLKQARESLSIADLCLDAQRVRADAGIRAATARSQRARSRADRMKATLSKVTSQEQYDEAEAAAVEAAANLDLSKVQLKDIKTQELSLDLRRDDVACAEAMVNIDQLALNEAQQRLADKKILAPIDGTVSACLVHPGQFVAAGLPSAETRLLTISNVSRLYVVANPGACQVRKIKPGQHATILSDAAPGERFSGCVVRATPCAKDSSATLKIEITSANRALLLPDMPVTVELGE